MKLLIYTRFENNTSGDETFLKIILPRLLEKLPRRSAINFLFAYDQPSTKRAIRLSGELTKMAGKADFVTTIWLRAFRKNVAFKTALSGDTKLLRVYSEAMCDQEEVVIEEIMKEQKTPPLSFKGLDAFVLAGWAHQCGAKDAKVFPINKISQQTKILLCSAPGGYIAKNNLPDELNKNGYTNVCCLQLGVNAAGGLPRAQNITNEIEKFQTAADWEQTLREALPEGEMVPVINGKKNLMVIYCSKDGPGTYGKLFVKDNGKDLHVILIGECPQAIEAEWRDLQEDSGYKSLKIIPRLPKSVFLFALKTAQFAMVSGVFSYLDCLENDIKCELLTPGFLTEYRKEIELIKNEPGLLEKAYKRSEACLEELSRFPLDSFQIQDAKYIAQEHAMKESFYAHSINDLCDSYKAIGENPTAESIELFFEQSREIAPKTSAILLSHYMEEKDVEIMARIEILQGMRTAIQQVNDVVQQVEGVSRMMLFGAKLPKMKEVQTANADLKCRL